MHGLKGKLHPLHLIKRILKEFLKHLMLPLNDQQ
jgi:hypothetical protein